MQTTAARREPAGVLHDRTARLAATISRSKNNPLAGSAFLCRCGWWHVSRDIERMIILLISFLALSALLCGLVLADRQATGAIEAVRVREGDNS